MNFFVSFNVPLVDIVNIKVKISFKNIITKPNSLERLITNLFMMEFNQLSSQDQYHEIN